MICASDFLSGQLILWHCMFIEKSEKHNLQDIIYMMTIAFFADGSVYHWKSMYGVLCVGEII